MDKQTFWAFTFYIFAICGSAILLVSIAPQAGQIITFVLTGFALLLWGMYAVIRKIDGE